MQDSDLKPTAILQGLPGAAQDVDTVAKIRVVNWPCWRVNLVLPKIAITTIRRGYAKVAASSAKTQCHDGDVITQSGFQTLCVFYTIVWIS